MYTCRGRDILQNDRMMSQVGKKKKVLETILSENHFRVPPMRAPTFSQGTTSTMETNTTRTICILCQGMRSLGHIRKPHCDFCFQRRAWILEALQSEPQHPGLQEQAGDQSPGLTGAGQVDGKCGGVTE